VTPFEAITAIATALEHSGLGQSARGTGGGYLLANLVHVLGAALLVGSIATFDVQVLRHARDLRIVYRAAIAIAVTGFVLQVASGFVLLSADASALVRNPAFLFKMAILAAGLINVVAFHVWFGSALKTGESLPAAARVLAAVSLASWVLVLLAGRTIAYV
jgi:hypothetical protein